MSDKLTALLIVFYLILAIVSVTEKNPNVGRTLYWIGAAILTYGVLRMK